MDNYNLVHFKDNAIRVAQDDEGGRLLFSIVDIVAMLTRSMDARKYWNTLKQRISKSDEELIGRCGQSSLMARDGKRRMTDVAPAEVVTELMDHIPGGSGPETESFRKWLFLCGRMQDEVLPFQTIPFKPGHAVAAVSTIQNEDLRKMAEAEFAYYTGNAEEAARITALYLDDGEINIRITAAYIYAFANMHLRKHYKAATAFKILEKSLKEAREFHSEKIHRVANMLLFAVRTVMHMPTDDMDHDIGLLVPELPKGLKSWACYIHCYDLYRREKYEQILGVVETATAFTNECYPVPLSYLNSFAAIALVHLNRMDEAEVYLDRVMELCGPDGLFEVLGEMQHMLHGLVDVYIKPKCPGEAEKIDRYTEEFFNGWLEMREMMTDSVALTDVSRTEFLMAVLASRGWKNKEIAEYLGFSQNTVKKYLSNVFDKLNVGSRKELLDVLMR